MRRREGSSKGWRWSGDSFFARACYPSTGPCGRDAVLRRVRENIRHQERRLGKPVVHVMHDRAEALAGSAVVAMNARRGRSLRWAPRARALRRACPSFVVGFTGKANVIEIDVVFRSAPPDGEAGLFGAVRRAVCPGGHMEHGIDASAGFLVATAPSTEPTVAAGVVSLALRSAIPFG